MRQLIILFILFSSITRLYCQSQPKTDSLIFSQIEKCEHNKASAESDITKETVKFFCYGSIVPVAMSKQDKQFERKYNIKYIQLGCRPFSFDCMKQYNQTIEKYLDEKYGISWRTNPREDIYGVTK